MVNSAVYFGAVRFAVTVNGAFPMLTVRINLREYSFQSHDAGARFNQSGEGAVELVTLRFNFVLFW